MNNSSQRSKNIKLMLFFQATAFFIRVNTAAFIVLWDIILVLKQDRCFLLVNRIPAITGKDEARIAEIQLGNIGFDSSD